MNMNATCESQNGDVLSVRPTHLSITPPALSPKMQRLVKAVEDLSRTRSAEEVREVVGRAGRELTNADGATFVVRDGDQCHYVDEDAIAPLWKGQRFPIRSCVSGWAMLHGSPVIIENIFEDPRVPVDAYRKTFVKSLVMVPIRAPDSIGAIGNYWSETHRATPEEVQVLQALANTTAVALENVRIYAELEQRVRERTIQLEHANEDLQSLAASVSHDLRTPLAVISGCADILKIKNGDLLDEKSHAVLQQIPCQVMRMSTLIDDLLRLARIREAEITLETVDLTALAHEIAFELQAREPDRPVQFYGYPTSPVEGDAPLLRIALENLFANAWKYTRRTSVPRVEFGETMKGDGGIAFYVRDNGAGFDMAHADRLFTPFRRLHPQSEYPGTGVGLSIAERVLRKHGGRIWAEGHPGRGATFYFALGRLG